MGSSKMDNLEKLAVYPQDTQDEEKQNTTQYELEPLYVRQTTGGKDEPNIEWCNYQYISDSHLLKDVCNYMS